MCGHAPPKFGWWAPWTLTRPWLPRVWRGSDQWHNPAVSAVLPLLGAVHVWFATWQDDTDRHHTLAPVMDVPDCPVCITMAGGDELPKGWWWNPPRAGQ